MACRLFDFPSYYKRNSLSTHAKPPNWLLQPALQFDVRLSSAGDPLQHLKKSICVICVADYVYMTRYICIHVYLIMYTCKIIMYTCIDNYVYMQDDYVNKYT